jgi:signal transduction histidine kinase
MLGPAILTALELLFLTTATLLAVTVGWLFVRRRRAWEGLGALALCLLVAGEVFRFVGLESPPWFLGGLVGGLRLAAEYGLAAAGLAALSLLLTRGRRAELAGRAPLTLGVALLTVERLASLLPPGSLAVEGLASAIGLAGAGLVGFALWGSPALRLEERLTLAFMAMGPVAGLGAWLALSLRAPAVTPEDRAVMFFIALFSLLLIGSLGPLLARRINEPIAAIMQGAKQIEQGRLDVKIACPTHDELEELASTFNLMVNAIRINRRDLEEKLVKLEELDRLRSEFMANLSHELRTPLVGILGYTDLLLEGAAGALTEEQARYIRSANEQGARLQSLINDLLDFAKLEMGRMPFRPEELDLAKLARDAVARYLPLARHRGLELRSEVPAPLLVRADPQKIALVLSHLVNNATKFTNRGGRITIGAERRETAADPRDRGVWVHVSDTGIGIPKQKLPIVFEKFRQGDGSATRGYGGTGIGLSLAKSFVEMHGGRMWVESEVRVGSRFSFILPLEPPRSRGAAAEPPLARTPTG